MVSWAQYVKVKVGDHEAPNLNYIWGRLNKIWIQIFVTQNDI